MTEKMPLLADIDRLFGPGLEQRAAGATPPGCAENIPYFPGGKGVFDAELQVAGQPDLRNDSLNQYLPGHHVEPDQHLPDFVVIARGGQNNQGIRDLVGHNADDFLEERRLALYGLNHDVAAPAAAAA